MNPDWRTQVAGEMKALRDDQIGILAFLNRIIQLKDANFATSLSFRFLDFDDSGALGSIDILALAGSFNEAKMEEVKRLFLEEKIKRDLKAKLAAKLARKKTNPVGDEAEASDHEKHVTNRSSEERLAPPEA